MIISSKILNNFLTVQRIPNDQPERHRCGSKLAFV
jgi:hypothetical protein